jgi:tetratricopeptide (TPR) repeat protein
MQTVQTTVVRTLIRSTLSLAVLAIVSLGSAQSLLNPAARESLQRGHEAMRQALATYEAHYPDRPLWQEAIRAGREAQRQAPGRPEPLRFLGEVYTITKWYGPAWNTWMSYLDAGGRLDAEVRAMLVEVGSELGYINYQRGNYDLSLRYYRRVIDLVPDALNAYVWAGRILIETNRPAQAVPYWQEVVDRDPGDARARYFLELARDQAEWGVEAVNAFREGVRHYEEGNLSAARERFARATSLNDRYAQAWAWLGRVEFERGNYRDARTFYQNASRLEPGNETYRYFAAESQRRLEGN